MGFKIIGLGLQKTGTTSMAAALERLGYRTKHFVPELISDGHNGGEISPEGDVFEPGQVDLKILDCYDAFVDNPLPFQYVYEAIENSAHHCKFILTTRPKENWIESVRNHITQDYYKVTLADRILKYYSYNPYEDIIYSNDNLGILEYLYYSPYPLISDDDIEKRYDNHHSRVHKQFGGRDDFIVMNLEDGDGWGKLCSFLGEDRPKSSFPHKKKTAPDVSMAEKSEVYRVTKNIHSMLKNSGKKILKRVVS